MDPARGGRGNKNLRLPVGKLIAGAKGMDAARCEKCACAQSDTKKNSRSFLCKQGDLILPGPGARVKNWSTPARKFQPALHSASRSSALFISLTGLPFQYSVKFSIEVKDLVRMRSI